jgi:hypothetical protein
MNNKTKMKKKKKKEMGSCLHCPGGPRMTGRARGFSEDERAKGRGERSLFPSSNKSCLKVVSRETSSFSSLHFVLALDMALV